MGQTECQITNIRREQQNLHPQEAEALKNERKDTRTIEDRSLNRNTMTNWFFELMHKGKLSSIKSLRDW